MITSLKKRVKLCGEAKMDTPYKDRQEPIEGALGVSSRVGSTIRSQGNVR